MIEALKARWKSLTAAAVIASLVLGGAAKAYKDWETLEPLIERYNPIASRSWVKNIVSDFFEKACGPVIKNVEIAQRRADAAAAQAEVANQRAVRGLIADNKVKQRDLLADMKTVEQSEAPEAVKFAALKYMRDQQHDLEEEAKKLGTELKE